MSVLTKAIANTYFFDSGWTTGWANVRAQATAVVSTSTSARGWCTRDNPGTNYKIARSTIVFDTSAIPANATITSVILNWWRNYEINEQNSDPNLYVCPVSATGNNGSYYNQTYFGSQVGIISAYYSYPRSGANPNVNAVVSLNPSCIVKGGNTILGFRIGHDYNGNVDSPSNIDKYNWLDSRTDLTNLVITYTTPPVVTSGSATNKDVNSVTLAGNVTDAGGGTVAERGIVYGVSADPTTADGKKMVAGTTGAYTGDITGLAGSTLYHYRAYVITENSTQYGDDQTFTTLPACETNAMTNLGVGSATANGNVTSAGEAITERGFVWGVATAPTVSDNKVVVAGTTGAMSVFITAMPIGRRVYLRSFATNETGTVYGNEINFIMVGGVAVFNCL